MGASSIRSGWSSTLTQETKAQKGQEPLAPGGSAGQMRAGTRILFSRGLLRPGIFPLCSLQL